MEPVAGRSGGDGLPFGFGNPVEFVGPFADGPDACGGDDLVVPDAVDVEFVRFVVFVLEQYVVFHVVGRVFDVRRAVHVAHQVNDVFEVDSHGRVSETAVVFQVFDGQFQSVDGVAPFRVQQLVGIAESGIDGCRVPAVGEGVFGGFAVFVHPFGVVDDGVSPEVFFDAFFSSLRQVALGDFGDGFVPFASPSENGSGLKESGAQQQEQ